MKSRVVVEVTINHFDPVAFEEVFNRVLIISFGILFILFHISLVSYVKNDISKRKDFPSDLWIVLVLFTNIIGFSIYVYVKSGFSIGVIKERIVNARITIIKNCTMLLSVFLLVLGFLFGSLTLSSELMGAGGGYYYLRSGAIISSSTLFGTALFCTALGFILFGISRRIFIQSPLEEDK